MSMLLWAVIAGVGILVFINVVDECIKVVSDKYHDRPVKYASIEDYWTYDHDNPYPSFGGPCDCHTCKEIRRREYE